MKDYVKPYFVAGDRGGRYFSNGKPASRFFEKECPNGAFQIQIHINDYYESLGDDTKNIGHIADRVKLIRESIRDCGNVIYEGYVTRHKKLQEDLKRAGPSPPDWFLLVLESASTQDTPRVVEELKTFFSNWVELRKQCVQTIQSSPEGEGYREDSNLHEETFGHTLEEMQGNGCASLKDNLKRKEAFFQKFIETPSLCAKARRQPVSPI